MCLTEQWLCSGRWQRWPLWDVVLCTFANLECCLLSLPKEASVRLLGIRLVVIFLELLLRGDCWWNRREWRWRWKKSGACWGRDYCVSPRQPSRHLRNIHRSLCKHLGIYVERAEVLEKLELHLCSLTVRCVKLPDEPSMPLYALAKLLRERLSGKDQRHSQEVHTGKVQSRPFIYIHQSHQKVCTRSYIQYPRPCYIDKKCRSFYVQPLSLSFRPYPPNSIRSISHLFCGLGEDGVGRAAA